MTIDLAQHQTTGEWLNGLRIMHRAHIDDAKRHERAHRVLGGVSAVLGAVTATAVFSNLQENPKTWLQVVAGALALATVAVSVVHTFLNHSNLAASHRSSAANYGALRREFEQRVMTDTVDDKFLTEARTTWSRLDRDAPTLNDNIYARVFEQVTGRKLT